MSTIPATETVHFMADIETLGTKHRPVITSIAIVALSKRSGILGRFYGGVDLASCMRLGGRIDPEALMYWLDPKKDEARAEWVTLPKLDISDTLDAAAHWVRSQWDNVPVFADDAPDTGAVADRHYKIGSLWGKGSTFDCVILTDYADACGIDWPFDFRMNECYRTLVNRTHVPRPVNPLAHSAIRDAETQALHLLEIAAVYDLDL
jgi:hypothetical protein